MLEAEAITYSKLIGVSLCVLGVVLVSLQDREEADGAVAHSLWGDIVAALGAALYGLFSTVLKVKVRIYTHTHMSTCTLELTYLLSYVLLL